ncbi:MAG TPA: ATP-binding protein [Ktedonosporobacter sp.]|jgi:nicotinamide riboside kinase|nr:ATP-binding protein [Ktedonosporobacter sp.]
MHLLQDEANSPFNRTNWSQMRQPPDTIQPGIRVGITGAQGVGKSTLARALAQELNLPLIEEVARTVQSLGFTLGLATTLLAQAAMWFAQFDLEHRLQSYIADRTLFDVVTHSSLLVQRTQNKQDELLVNTLGNATACILGKHYSFFFYIPIEFPLEGDGVREQDLQFQQALDVKTLELLQEFQLPYVTLRGSIAERFAHARQVIGEYSKDSL